MEDWLVSDKTCKGCKYYGSLGWNHTNRCCDYTYITGRFRENKPAECEVKTMKQKRNPAYRKTIRKFNPLKKNFKEHSDG